MERGNSKRYGKDQSYGTSSDAQAEASVSGLSADKTAAPLSIEQLLDTPEDYAWSDGVHTVYRPLTL